jgi:type II secretion system protein N
MKKPLEILSLLGLFLFSFVLFLYLTFPYEVLKETISVELSGATGYSVRIGELSPRLPLGAEVKDVAIEIDDSAGGLKFSSISADISLFSLLIGNIAPEMEIESGGGKLKLESELSVFDLIGGNFFPTSVSIEAKKFPVDDLITFTLNSGDPSSNPMIGLLSNIGLKAKLNGNIDFELNSKNLTRSKGAVNLNLSDAKLILSHPMVGLADQKFKRAKIMASVESGKIQIDKTSKFVSNDLDIGLSGKVDLQSRIQQSRLNLEVAIKVGGEIQKVFGWIIGSATKDPARDSQCKIRVKGLLSQPNTAIF